MADAFSSRDGDTNVQHLLYVRHCSETLKRRLRSEPPVVLEQIYTALFRRCIEAGCLQSIATAKAATSAEASLYIARNWEVDTRKWAYWARAGNPLLIQLATISPVEN